MGVTIRHYFNTSHARKGNPVWTWGVTAVLFAAVMWLSTAPLRDGAAEQPEGSSLTDAELALTRASGFEDVHGIVVGRCSMCHAREPLDERFVVAPRGIFLETEADVARAAREIFLQAGITHAMPPANVSGMDEDERQKIAAWFREARSASDKVAFR